MRRRALLAASPLLLAGCLSTPERITLSRPEFETAVRDLRVLYAALRPIAVDAQPALRPEQWATLREADTKLRALDTRLTAALAAPPGTQVDMDAILTGVGLLATIAALVLK